MFGGLSISSFKGQPEAFRLTLGFRAEEGDDAHRPGEGGALRQDTVTVDWLSSDSEAEILRRIAAALDDPDVVEERVQARLTTDAAARGVVSASSYQNEVNLSLKMKTSKPALRSVELLRTTATGGVTTALGLGIWALLDVAAVTRLRCNEGAASLWDDRVLGRFTSLRALNLSHGNLTSLPGVVGALAHLQELRLVGNKLKILPPELGRLSRLRVLAADRNELSILPGELRRCAELEELTLEDNRLTSVLLNFSAFPRLAVLHLFNNPLEFLPEIAPCGELRDLSVANLRVSADREFAAFRVELLAPAPAGAAINMSLFDSKNTDALRPIFSLMLRRSSGHHQLLAGALRHLAEDPKNRDLMAKQENALQQLILMALNDNEVVVEQTCLTLTSLALHSAALAEAIVQADLGSMLGLLRSRHPTMQLSSLRVLAAIGLASPAASARLLSDSLLASLQALAGDGAASPELRCAALEALGNLAFGPAVKARLAAQPELLKSLLELATGAGAASLQPARVRAAALRALAILGENEAVGRAVGRRPVRGRGLRVLSMDGGGMKGMATVRLLRQLEARTGRRVHELFDLIVGTSTGGLLAVALGLRHLTLDECEAIYKVLGQQVFSRAAANKDREETWMESFYRAFHTKTQHVRAVVVGYKHDASVYEALLKDYCDVARYKRCLGNAMIDAACLDAPKVALVAALASASPAVPFVFRNYELPPGAEALRAGIAAHGGSSKHAVWQAVRASSAAIYYLDDFSCGGDKFQDGAVVANNPSVVALQEARLLWPDAPIDVFVSVGTGSTPAGRRDRGMSSYVDTGNILIESATSVERVHEALATTLPMVPHLRYFRFNPVDPRCGMELDEVDPLKWAGLEDAVDEHVAANSALFDEAAAALTRALDAPAAGAGGAPARGLRLGARRGVVVVTAARSVAEPSAADVAAAACARLATCVGAVDLQGVAAAAAAAAHAGSSASPPGGGGGSSIHSHPVALEASELTPAKSLEQRAAGAAAPAAAPRSPAAAAGAQDAPPAVVEVDLGSALGSVLSWFSPAKSHPTTPTSPSGPKEQAAAGREPSSSAPASSPPAAAALASPAPSPPSPPPPPPRQPLGSSAGQQGEVVEVLRERLAAARPTAGVVHLALRASPAGLVLGWAERVEAIVEPSAAAAELLLRAGFDPALTSLSQVFEDAEAVEAGGAEVRVLSTQSQRLRGEKLALLLVQHTAPAALLDAAALHRLRGALSGQLVVCSAALGGDQVAAVLGTGALAVVCLTPEGEAAAEAAGGRALAGFFAELYAALQQGSALVAALDKAGATHPALRPAFVAFALEGAAAVALE